MLSLKGKNRLMVDQCPAYLIGNYDKTPIITFGLNPGYNPKNNPTEDAEARSSWEKYQDLYRNFFHFFARSKFESPYYTALWHLLVGLTEKELTRELKWELFDRFLTNIE